MQLSPRESRSDRGRWSRHRAAPDAPRQTRRDRSNRPGPLEDGSRSVWLANREMAVAPQWDHLRRGVLGSSFRGCLLQLPFAALVRAAGRESPTRHAGLAAGDEAVLGGVALAVPISLGVQISRDDVLTAGWDVYTTDSVAPKSVPYGWNRVTTPPPSTRPGRGSPRPLGSHGTRGRAASTHCHDAIVARPVDDSGCDGAPPRSDGPPR